MRNYDKFFQYASVLLEISGLAYLTEAESNFLGRLNLLFTFTWAIGIVLHYCQITNHSQYSRLQNFGGINIFREKLVSVLTNVFSFSRLLYPI